MNVKAAMRRDPEKIKKGLKLVDDIYDYSLVGASLHIATDDGNMNDSSLLYCIKVAVEALDDHQSSWHEYARDNWNPAYEINVAAFLLTCSYAERLEIYRNKYTDKWETS